jgi:hypothetical protein
MYLNNKRMKKLFFTLLFTLFAHNTEAQEINPYKDFGYLAKNEYVRTKKPIGIEVNNADTTGSIQRIIVSTKLGKVFVYSLSGDVNVINASKTDQLRFLSTDPLTGKYPELTPYQFASNRPIDGIDFDGLEYISFFVRSYEHSAVFATPFVSLGDNRKASTASDASARIHFKMDVKADEHKLEQYRAWSSPTVQLLYSPSSSPVAGLAKPVYTASADNKGNYSFDTFAPNPIMSKIPLLGKLTPDIDIKGSVNITSSEGILNIKGQIRGDGFPDAESFVKDRSGQAILLGTYNHGALASPVWSLPGDGDKPMISVNVGVQLNADGNFTKAWSIDDKGNKTALPIIAPETKK